MMSRYIGLQILSLLCLNIIDPVCARQVDAPLLSVERIFSGDRFQTEFFWGARWLEDGRGYTMLEASEEAQGGIDLVLYDPERGEKNVLVAASRLIPDGSDEPLAVNDYAWSPDGSKLLIFTNSRRVWRTNTRGDYWVLDLESGALKQLGGDADPSTLMFAKFSPDGTRVGYVRENNLYVEYIADGRIIQLTSDGSKTLINGTFDWVYEEEFSLRDGFRWSPDGSKIAFWQLDASGIRDFLLINNTDSLYSFVTPIQYPKAGTTNSSCRVGVIDAEGGETVWFEPSDDLRNHYIARMDWAAGSEEIVMHHLNRRQNRLELILGEVETGRMETTLVETDSAWVDLRIGGDLNWLDGGERFTWISERSGWRHFYTASRDGGQLVSVTSGVPEIMGVAQLDVEGGWLYYYASPENPTERYLFRSRLDGRDEAERLTPDVPGWHNYDIAPGARYAFHTYSQFGVPPVTELIRLPGHEVVRTLVDNALLKERLAEENLGETRFFRVDIGDGVMLDGWEIRPPEFDESRQYPVLFYVYGEPAGQTVINGWSGSGYLWHQMLAQKGYVVISIDNRGTPAPRGRAWRKIVYGSVGVLASADQAAAARVIADWPYVDGDRVGIWGWSAGGSMTLNALFRYPEIYKTGISVAPVPDLRYYDTIYQERIMGLPQENAEGYRQGSPITFADRLEGNLLLIHGTGDDNVHYQGTESLINKLIEHGKQFTMMSYPNRTHGIWEGEGTTLHLYTLMQNYLLENLPAGLLEGKNP